MDIPALRIRIISAAVMGIVVLSVALSGCSLPFVEASPLPYNQIAEEAEENFQRQDGGIEAQSAKIDLYSLEELIISADCIVTGKVSEILPSRENKNATNPDFRIYTDVLFEPQQLFFGDLYSNDMAIRLRGGNIGNLKIWAEDEPIFEEGEYCLLFLYHPDDDVINPLPPGIDAMSCYRVLGSMQGKYEYNGETVTAFNGNEITVTSLQDKISDIRY